MPEENLALILITLLILGKSNTNSNWEEGKITCTSTYSLSPSNDAGFNNAQDLLFCSTVVKNRPFSFPYSHGRNNY